MRDDFFYKHILKIIENVNSIRKTNLGDEKLNKKSIKFVL